MYILIALWVAWSFLNGGLAYKRGHSPAGPIVASLVLSPLLGTVILLCMKPRVTVLVRQARQNVERERLEAYFRQQPR